MLRVGEHLGHGALLHQMAVLHHRHPVGELAHQVQVVRDQQHRHAVLPLQLGQQVQDLRAQRHVQRRGRLVGQQQPGPARQRHRDHRALALAARELVRISDRRAVRARGCPVAASAAIAPCQASRAVRPCLSCSTSAIWSPTV